jgi:outer membrane protein assembly factor BamB
VDGNAASGEVPAGVYRVAVAADGCQPGVDAVRVSRGSDHTVVVQLAHLRGRIDLDVQPEGASVRVDGADHGSRLANLELDTGRYAIEVSKRGHLARAFEVEIHPDETVQQFVYLPRIARWERHASGVNHELRWAGDLTGDGRDDVYHRNFATLSAYDPWTDATLWSLTLPEQGQSLAFLPIEHAAVEDLVAVWTGLASCGVRAVAGRQRGPGLRELWSLESARRADDSIAWMVPAVGIGTGPVEAIAVALPWDKRRVLVVDAKTGQTRWRIDADTAVIGTVGLRDGLFVATRDAVEARDADGRVRWRRPVALYDDAAREATRESGEDLLLHRTELAYAAELDGDGVPDLLVGAPDPTASRWQAFAGSDGHPLWSTTLPGWRPGLSTFERHDADGDGIDDFVVRTHRRDAQQTEVSVLDGRTGQARWRRGGAGFAMLATAEGPVVPVANAEGLALLDAVTGEPRLRLGDAQRSSVAPVLADMDADGAPEVVVAQGSSLTFYDLDGREAGRASLSRAVTRLGSPRDADGDGFEDMLADAVGPMVLQAASVRWARTTPHALRSTPVIADFDADGRLDLAVVAHLDDEARVHILDAGTGRRRHAGPPAAVIRDLRTRARADGTLDVVAVSHADATLRAMAGHTPYEVRTMEFATSYATPGVGDLTGDGVEDVVVASWEAPAAYLVDGASWARGWQVDLTQGSFVEPLIVDLDGDDVPEVLLGTNDGMLTAVDRAGATKWTRQIGGAKHSYPPALVTLATGRRGLVVADSAPADEASPATVVLDAATGDVVLRIEDSGDRAVAVRVVDADHDGVPEILTTKAGAYCSLPLAGGEPNWCHAARSAVDEPIPPYGQPTVVDLDGDGVLEVIVGFAGGELRVLDAATGELRWSYATGFKIEARPLAHDVDGDGLAEVFVASHDGTLCCLGGRPASRGRLSDAHARLDSADTPTKKAEP